MEFSPQKFREIVFQLLYSIDIGGSSEAELIPFMMSELSVSKKNVTSAFKKAECIWKQREQLDLLIGSESKNYSIERIKTVEKNVLRLALYELLQEKELSATIIISEAHRLTRKFGTVEGASFVNALLDKWGKQDNGSAFCVPAGEVAE